MGSAKTMAKLMLDHGKNSDYIRTTLLHRPQAWTLPNAE